MNIHKGNKIIFKHFLLTTFNALPTWVAPFPNKAWHKHRFKLFDQIAYPSVREQSNQNFTWIVVFSVNTSEVYKEKVKKYAEYNNFIPVYIPEGKHPDEVSHDIIPHYLTDETKYLITTRMYTDDAICKDFVQMIQDCFDKQEFQFINFFNGYCWDTNFYEIYSFKYQSNPFISLIEEIDSNKNIDRFPTLNDKYPKYSVKKNRRFITVWNGFSHPDFIKIGSYKEIKTKPAWVQGIDRSNLSNTIRGELLPPGVVKHLNKNFTLRKNLLLPYLTSSLIYFIRQIFALTRNVRSSLGLTSSRLKKFKEKLRS